VDFSPKTDVYPLNCGQYQQIVDKLRGKVYKNVDLKFRVVNLSLEKRRLK